MTKEIQFRRGSTADHISGVGFTGALAEVTVDTTNNTLRVHDGSTLGGHELVGVAVTQTITNKTIVATALSVTGVSTFSSDVYVGTAITFGASSGIVSAFTGSFDIFSVKDQLTIGVQSFYAQGSNGFSVNEDFDPSNSATQTAYHYTSGAGRETVAFTLARTAQFTNGFGIYGTSADNTFVSFGEQNNTNWEWRRGVGIRPLNLDGGTPLMKLRSNGNLGIGTTNARYTLELGVPGVTGITSACINGSLELAELFVDSSRQVGAAGSVLISTGTATRWAKAGISTVLVTTYASGTGTFTTNANTLLAQVYVTGAGGGGGAADSDGSAGGAAGGGGAGGTSIKWFNREELGATASYSVGTAGAAGSGNGGNGGAGGNSTFTPAGTGSVLTGSGGSGGTGTGSAYAPAEGGFNGGNGGAATNGDINHSGLDGGYGIAPSAATLCGGNGGASYHGGGANAPVLNVTGNSVGNAATIPGGGGSGAVNGNSTTSRNGGAGAAGRIIVVEYLSGGFL